MLDQCVALAAGINVPWPNFASNAVWNWADWCVRLANLVHFAITGWAEVTASTLSLTTNWIVWAKQESLWHVLSIAESTSSTPVETKNPDHSIDHHRPDWLYPYTHYLLLSILQELRKLSTCYYVIICYNVSDFFTQTRHLLIASAVCCPVCEPWNFSNVIRNDWHSKSVNVWLDKGGTCTNRLFIEIRGLFLQTGMWLSLYLSVLGHEGVMGC